MIILKDAVDLTTMKIILQRELPHSINVLGGVMHVLHNNWCHLEICVDSWPTFTTVLCYRENQPFSSCSSLMMPDICAIFTKDPAALRLLLKERIVKWRSGLLFRGIQNQHIPLVKELALLHGLDITEVRGHTTFIHQSPENKEWQKKVCPLPVSILDESHAELVDKHLPYGGSQESINFIRTYIRHLPNQCVMSEKGQPVSWMLSDELCELRMVFTLPEYRRAGCLKTLCLTLIRRMSSIGMPIFCQIHNDNQTCIDLFTSIGFTACLEHISVQLICKDGV